jgi:hypothetical protein
MTRSHALLHCRSATLGAARVEALEGRSLGRIGVLQSSPWRESRLLRFWELLYEARRVGPRTFGAGRKMSDLACLR